MGVNFKMNTVKRIVRYVENIVNLDGSIISHHIEFSRDENTDDESAAILAMEMVGARPGGKYIIVDPDKEPAASQEEIEIAWGMFVDMLVALGELELVYAQDLN